MKTAMIAAVAVLSASTSAFAQDATSSNTDVDVDNDVVVVDTDVTVVEDSFDNNTDNSNDSFNDNSNREFNDSFDDNRDYVDSFDDNSDNIAQGVGSNKTYNFNGAAIVADTALSNVVTGVDVDYGDLQDTARLSNNLVNRGSSFRNYAGNNALNQNTGVGASQNASVTIAVSGDSFGGN